MATSSRADRHETSWSVVRCYLVERDLLFARIQGGVRLRPLLLHMTGVSALFAAVYGTTVGLYAGGWQVLYDAIKLPGMMLATVALSLLTLYMLSSLTGSRLSLGQTAALVLSAVLVTTILLFALTPPLGFVMLTSLQDYELVVFLNIVVIVICGLCGASFALQATAAVQKDPAIRESSLRVMKAWMVLYGLIGMQMLWMFRPYFRQTDVFIRPVSTTGSAFVHFGRLLLHLLEPLL
ncbi:MAG: hypothetical protein U9R79_19340 [Armatimonadota bacterium]|nr:hypothetical protein [Armatimonadota bacterium]